MKKYICPVCGYVYDETAGIPEEGIAPGTKWIDLPEDWMCPMCGAVKDDFEEQKKASQNEEIGTVIDNDVDLGELSAGMISAVCSNLAKGCEKQYKPEAAECFAKLAQYYQIISKTPEIKSFTGLAKLVKQDLDSGYADANAVANEAADRGAMRALVWGEKVTKIVSSALSRYEKQKDALLKDTNIHVCEICGFVYIGEEPPEVCPVCKVPKMKIRKIGREAI